MAKTRRPNAHGSRPWTEDELETLRINWADWPSSIIAHILKRSQQATATKAHLLGLRKAPDFGAKMERLKQLLDLPKGDRFEKGQTPHNKGVRRPGWAPGRMAETQFKPGRAPEQARNYKPIGSLRISPDGYLERKVTDDRSIVPARRWVGVHRLVWEKAVGPIPSGHAVAFLPGRRTTVESEITLDRLELVSRRELMRRNTVHNYPPELVGLIRVKAGLVRKIRRREREEQDR